MVTMSTVMMGFTPLTVAAETAGSMPTAPAKTGKVVRGTVVDSQGPLIGATVMEKGTNNGTVTDFDGNYSLKVSNPDAVLEVKYVGYLTEELAISGMSVVNFKLKEDGHNLNEVVVIGYGTQRKESVTGSVASMKGDIMREVPGADITQAMQGRIAGVQMMQTSSKPGASMQIRVRGTRSLTADNDPLIVLDGIPFAGTINDIDPSSIKSMDILKDASATAIYGSRGANGVIMVTTNKGSKGSNAQIKYNMYVGLKTNFAEVPMMNGDQLSQLRKVSGKYKNSLDEIDGTNTNWQDLLYENAFTTNHDISVSGGSATNSYNAGISYFRDESIIPTQTFKRYAMHGALDQEVGRYVKVGVSSNSNFSVSHNSNLGLYSSLSCSPLISPYNEDGSPREIAQMPQDKTWVVTGDRYKSLGDTYADESNTMATYNSFYGELKCPWVEGLKYRINLGLNFRYSDYGTYTGSGVFSADATTPGENSNTEAKWNWAIEHLLTFDRTFGKHTINFVGLFAAEKAYLHKTVLGAQDVFSDYQLWYNPGYATTQSVSPNDQKYEDPGLTSVMGRIMYNYADKYMLSVTVRNDKSSRLAIAKRSHTYPAISLGWNISKEEFMQNISWVNNLKLRAGYGETSNQAVDPFKTLGLLAPVAYNFGSKYATGFYLKEAKNDDLGWEYSNTYNVGVDFSLFGGRLSGTAEYYIQNTHDLLLSLNLPSTSGLKSQMANVGKTQNRGFELSLNGIIIENKDWTWEAGLNFYSNKNEITELADGSTRDEGNGWFVGHPINVLYDYEKIGIWQSDEEELRKILEPGGNAGMIKVKGGYDENGNPRAINASDRQIIELDPSWEGGFNTRVAYKNWDLSMVASFRHGGKLISTLYGASGYLNMLTGRRNNVDVNYWTENNPTNDYPFPGGILSGDNPKYGNSLALFSGSYLKFRTITLGYNFKGEWMKKVGLTSLRAYATVTNPFVLFSPYNNESGMDPETNSKGDENQASSSYNSKILVVGTNTPTTRNYLFGLNVTF